jgi:hypothetical protein
VSSERPYTIRVYEPGDEHAILALFNEVFAEDDPSFVPRTLEQWRWLFERNPCGNQVVVAVEPSGRIVAQYATLPARARMGESPDDVVVCGQGVDSMVHRDYRRGLKREGAFLQTARHYFATIGRWPVCGFGYGFPNRKAYPIGVRLIGYVPTVRPIPTLYRNFFESSDDDAVGREHVGAADVVDVASVASLPRGGAELDELWTRLSPRFPMALVRDAKYLAWRYDGCPWLAYRKFAVYARGDREVAAGGAAAAGTRPLRAFFVTRSNWQKLPIEALVDFVGDPDDAASLALALRTATRRAREDGQARVEAWLPQRSPLFRHALAAGFKTEPSQHTLVSMLYREKPDLDWCATRWYYTIGDSDVW